MRLGRSLATLAVVGALGVLGPLASLGCAKQEGVLRVVDGRVVEGPFVEPEAYAAFLRGAIAEERGEMQEALKAYAEAARYDPNDAEIWSRVARVLCVMAPRDRGADAALRRAFAIDPDYAEAWAVRAECAMARGDAAGAETAARRAVDADRLATELELLLARATRSTRGDSTRDRLVVLTLAHADSVAAWEALGAWARAHDDVPLYVRALSELARRKPLDRGSLAAAVVTLAGDGELASARMLAGAIVDAGSGDGFGSPLAGAQPIVARLAVDEALVRGDVERVRLRATRTHMGLEHAAGRAALLGASALARDLAAPVAAADPGARGARMVLAAVAAERGDASALTAAFAGGTQAPAPAIETAGVPAECLLAFARAFARAVSEEQAARFVASTPHERVLSGDALVAPIAADLAARGVLPESELPLDAEVELAARRMQPPPAAAFAAAPEKPAPLDARHELLAFAIARPDAPRAVELARRLARVRDRDALVAVAWARLDLAHAAPVTPAVPGGSDAAARLLARDPADPLVAAAALDVATRRGDAATAARARATLSAVARTPAERARSAQ